MSARAASVVRRRPRSRAVPRVRAAPGAELASVVETELCAAIGALRKTPREPHAGVHQARKHMRRARAALGLARRSLGPAAHAVDHAIARVCRSLSALRDAQALTEALQRLGVDDAPWIEVARTSALHRRDQVLRRELERDPGLERRVRRLRRALVRLPALNWNLLGESDIARALSRSADRVDAALRHASLHPGDDEAWHRLRRRLRRLRMQHLLLRNCAFDFAAVSPPNDELAHALGDSQDDALLLAHCAPGSPFPRSIRRELAAIAHRRIESTRQRAAHSADSAPGSTPTPPHPLEELP
jgi:hypothetical protein